MNKNSFIRKDRNSKKCPFGIPMTEACENAGDSISYMCSLEDFSKERREKVRKANSRTYIFNKDERR